ncbi:MAG: leucine-rich repeat protein, partial [Prevotella sp.]|nr:leucine-rich repeat protein [Candidatus Prevotella equi]
MKRLIYSLIFFLNVITSFATDISTWNPPAGGLKNTYSDSKTFVAKKGDILNCRCKGQISSGSYVNLYITGQGKREKIFSYNTSNNSFDKTITYDVPEDTEYTLEYEYYHNGGGTAYNIKVFASLTESISEEYTYPLEDNDIIHVNGLHYVCNGGTLTFGKCDADKYSGEITVPETVDYRGYRYTVTGIKAYTFQNNKNITKFIMPNSIIDMGNNVFQGCTSLEYVNLSSNLNEIPSHTFYGCSKIKEFNIPLNISTIGSYAFSGTGIKELIIPNSVKEIASNAFENCMSLTTVVIGNCVSIVGNEAFRGCSALYTVTVGPSVTSLADVFTYCTNVKELIYAEGCKETIYTGLSSIATVRFPSTMEEIHDNAFYRYHNLKSVNFVPSIKSIGESAFQGCEGLTTLSLPENLQNIGVKAFYYCKNIVGELIIPSTVRELGESSFDGCSNIQTLIIKDGVEIIGNKAFEDCKSLENVYFSNTLQSIGEYAFYCSSYSNQLKSLNFPSSLKYIGSYAFSRNMNLTTIEIPGSVETIENHAFYNCKNINHVKLNEGIINIGNNAFWGCYNFDDLFIPNSVTNIGEGAFAPWTGGEITSQLKNITIGNGVKTFKNITCGLNQGSAALEKIVIGSGISSIHDYNIQQRGVMFLLTNNMVTGIGPKVYVADSTKYSDTQIKNHNIRNLIKSSSYKGEYNGKAPEIGMVNNLDGYTATILPEFYNAGTYTSMDVEFTDERLTSIVSIPCNYTITKAQLKVVANDIVVSYGEDIPNLEYSYVGFKNSETEDVAISTKPTITTSAKKGSQSGTYTISIAGAEARNYSLSYQNGTLTIKKAPQTIEWNQTFPIVYNGDQIELTAASSCGLPITYTTSNADIAFVSNENGKAILHLLKDGIVQITATQSGNNNYEAAISISKAITITPRAATGISLNCSTTSVKEGSSVTLTAKLSPEAVIEKKVKWTTSDATVATVDNGIVT